MSRTNFENLSDEHILLLMKEGNELAFKFLYNKYWRELYSRAINVLRDKSQTEDVLHEIFVNMWNRRNELEIKDLRSYLFVAVRNNSIQKIKAEKYIHLEESDLTKFTVSADIEEMYAEKELKLKIERAMEELPSRRRNIFYMSRFQNYPITEIAKHFEISHRTVENQLHLALKHIRTKLKNSSILLFFLF